MTLNAVMIESLFERLDDGSQLRKLSLLGIQRNAWNLPHVGEVVRDSDAAEALDILFLRVPLAPEQSIEFRFDGDYRVQALPAGGWLLHCESGSGSHYWIPVLPRAHTVDDQGHLLTENVSEILGLELTPERLQVQLRSLSGGLLDVVVVKIAPAQAGLLDELSRFNSLETQRYFLYASHGIYRKPADLFHHLVHGRLYNGETAWPTGWRIHDELEAYALYLILSGLEQATGKILYGFLKRLVVMAIVDRQRDDGGWYHGEWTKGMECHVRLHCGGMHLLATALEERDDPVVKDKLRAATEFIARLVDQTDLGAWFLHDTLELSRETMNQGPFAWHASRALGKSATNMMVLNTHLDTVIAVDRYRRLTGDARFDELIASAQRATTAILAQRPFEPLYRWLYQLIDLTFLPVAQARSLPLPVRAVKRMTWKYLIPRMHYIRSWWPRLVMPNGYIDRALSLTGVSHAYQTVNLWDLVRYRRRFADPSLGDVIDKALHYTQETPIGAFWVEDRKKGHALGFWADALWHLCMADPDPRYRCWLAEALLLSIDGGWGVPPAVLGANTEAVSPAARLACPAAADPRLVVVNLSMGEHREFLVVNPTRVAIALTWEEAVGSSLQWSASDGTKARESMQVPPRGWVWGQ
ncbi:hypothetical protein [Thiocystis violascens]|uniref:Uncharacterized protein n=1 Tax=Thiocystis violascens (strain ATCC 17096 / DSM 198 / 6111) TaxID=765911 RepID=I3YFU8_THIV6|nr:hypothetical protein [Thiocystis violascens]AFL75866.1 hypothetical protein Thivi_4042 [Thiocystis violascens DSM 198]